MNALGKALALVVGLALLGAMGFGAWLVFQTVVALFAALDPALATVTGIACLIALAAAWWIARALSSALRQSKAMALREEKNAAYQLFVDYWQSRLAGAARSDGADNLKMLDRLLALYGAQAVIRAHTALRDLQRDERHSALRTGFGAALVAIRKDLGADTPNGAAQELERLLLPAYQAS
jgi:hypothetical protein